MYNIRRPLIHGSKIKHEHAEQAANYQLVNY